MPGQPVPTPALLHSCLVLWSQSTSLPGFLSLALSLCLCPCVKGHVCFCCCGLLPSTCAGPLPPLFQLWHVLRLSGQKLGLPWNSYGCLSSPRAVLLLLLFLYPFLLSLWQKAERGEEGSVRLSEGVWTTSYCRETFVLR